VQLNIAELIELRGAVFLIGAEEAQTAPLVTALTGYIAREARRLAALCPSGRLDPGLELVLDEAALICPVPLDRWTADMGGRNIGIHIGVQSAAQLVDRFGRAAADSILTNAATILIFGGTRSRDDLATYSMLVGDREETQQHWDHIGRVSSTTTRTVPVLSPALISQLPAGQVVVIKRGMFPMIGRAQMAWKRAEVKAAKREARWVRRNDAALRRIHQLAAVVRRSAEVFLAWAGVTLGGLKQRADQLLDRIAFAGEAWLDRVPGENREQRRVRRQIEAAQRRGRERGL
jgi:hypothetical protein